MRPWVWWGLWTLFGCGFVLLVPAMALADNCSTLDIPGDCETSSRAAAGGAAAGGAALGGLGGLSRGGRRTGSGAGEPMPGTGPETPGSNVPRDAPTGPSGPQREYVRQQEERRRAEEEYVRQQQEAERIAQRDAQRRAQETAADAQEQTRGVTDLTGKGRSPSGPMDQTPGDAESPGSNVERDDDTRR